jgi:YegS/Rv2252/BmrU family lipid kinase
MTASFKTLVITNPNAAGGATGKRAVALRAAFDAALGPVEHVLTSAPGHATVLAREAIKAGVEMIVAVGGDGTFNEVVNGFFEGERPVALGEPPILGIVPAGTGGDYRKSWGLSKSPADAIARLVGTTTVPADAGRIRWRDGEGKEQLRYFANIGSFGLSAEVSRRVNAGKKRLGGRASFFLASLGALGSHRRRQVTLLTDGDSLKRVALNFGACAIGQYFGGGMRMAPRAEPSDGLFDIVTVSDCSRFKLFAMLDIYSGKHLQRAEVAAWRGKVVDVTCDDPEGCYIEADGEVIAPLPARFEIVPRAFRMKVAP